MLDNRPSLNRWVGYYYSSFAALSSSRSVTPAGAGPIPLSEIKAFLDLEGERNIEERRRFVMMIRAMDGVFLDHVRKQRQKEADAQKLASSKVGPKGRQPRRRR